MNGESREEMMMRKVNESKFGSVHVLQPDSFWGFAVVRSGRLFKALQTSIRENINGRQIMFVFLNLLRFVPDLDGQSKEAICEVCYETYPTSEEETNTVSCSSGHKFCISCFRLYAEEAIFGMSKVVLSCMAPNCRVKYSSATVKHWLDKKLIEKLRENGKRNTRDDGPVKKSHLSRVDQERLKREERLTKKAIRRCPECKKAIIKEGGCNHVICPSCDTHMCFGCGVQVPPHEYQHVCGARTSPVRVSIDRFEPVEPWIERHHANAGGSIQRHPDGGHGAENLDLLHRTSRHVFDLGNSQLPSPTAASRIVIESTMNVGSPSTFSIFGREPTSVEQRLKDAVQLTTLFQRPPEGKN